MAALFAEHWWDSYQLIGQMKHRPLYTKLHVMLLPTMHSYSRCCPGHKTYYKIYRPVSKFTGPANIDDYVDENL